MKVKIKPIRLKGKAKIDLFRAVYDRDGECCVKCGKWIPLGVPPHHIIKRSQGGSDVKENLEMLCLGCHYKEHN